MDRDKFNQPVPERFSPPATIPLLPTHLPDPYEIGITFKSFKAAHNAIIQYIVIRGLSYKVKKAEKQHYVLICCSESCPFWLRLSLNKKQPVIETTVSIPHNCPLETHYNWQPPKSMKYLQPHHQNTFNNDHTIKARQLMGLEKAHGNNIKYKQAWHTLNAAQQTALSDDIESFEKIPAYLKQIAETDDSVYYHLESRDGIFC
jgi:hypothetical protein